MYGQPILIISDDEAVRKHIEDIVSKSGGYDYAAPIHGFPEPGGVYSVILLSEEALKNNPMRLDTFRSQHPASPVIIIGSHTSPDLQTQLAQLDIFSYLPANTSSEEITLTIRRAYELRKSLESWATETSMVRNSPAILSTLADGLISTDAEGIVQIINPAAIEYLNLGKDEWLGKPIQSVIQLPVLVEAILKPPPSYNTRITLESQPGQIYSAQIFPLPDGSKITTLHNITNAQDLALLKKELVQTISHDLRSPLTAILGYAELIGKVGSVNDHQVDFIHRVQSSVNMITKLIDALLALGAIETEFEVPSDKIHLDEVLKQSTQLLQPIIEEKSQTIRVDIAVDLPPVRGKAIWLNQMIINLIENAHKYSPVESEITITLSEKGQAVILEINDKGIGIPATEIPYIFDKLYRGSNLPLEAEGTGLGLAFVKSIVEIHNGRLWCESNESTGTTFTIMLPAAE